MIRGIYFLYFFFGIIKIDLLFWFFWIYCLNVFEVWLFVVILKVYGNFYNKKIKIIIFRYKIMVFLFVELFYVIKNE